MRFRRKAEQEPVELNLTPLIDVVFLMLIFFMVTTTFQKESELKVQLPRASAINPPTPAERIDLVVGTQGQYLVNGRELVNNQTATLRAALQQASSGNKQIPVVIRADRQSPVQALVTAMDAAAQAGLSRQAISTAKPSE